MHIIRPANIKRPKINTRVFTWPLLVKIKANKGPIKAPRKIAKEFTVPIVLKEELLVKAHGRINLLKSCKIPNRAAKEPLIINEIYSLEISFGFFTILVISK